MANRKNQQTISIFSIKAIVFVAIFCALIVQLNLCRAQTAKGQRIASAITNKSAQKTSETQKKVLRPVQVQQQQDSSYDSNQNQNSNNNNFEQQINNNQQSNSNYNAPNNSPSGTEDPLADSEPALYGSVAGAPGVDFPAFTKIPKTSFTCEGKGFNFGFYADEEAQCQVYHICWEGRRESFLCGVGTVFNQAILACDYWHSVDCSKSSQFYGVNSELGKFIIDLKLCES